MKLVTKPKEEAVSRTDSLQIRVTLIGSDPVIWRRIVVPARLHLGKLHQILQGVMGWQSSHLHEFVVTGKRYSDPDYDSLDVGGTNRTHDQTKIRLSEIAAKTKSFEYRYDFGDGWQHELTIEKLMKPDPRLNTPICIGGERACPPEDCGGIGGYANLLKTLSDPNSPDHDELLTWVGGYFDPSGFDANRVNRDFLWRKKW